MKSKELLYLTLLTIFAALFLFTFVSYRFSRERCENLSKEIKAYELFVSGDMDGFMEYVKKMGLPLSKELGFYLERFAQLELSMGTNEFENGNYGRALEHFRKVIDLDGIPETIELKARMMAGRSLYKLGRYDEAYDVLEVFLEDAKGFRLRNEGLVDLARVCVKLRRYDELESIKKELKYDEENLKKLMELESEAE